MQRNLPALPSNPATAEIAQRMKTYLPGLHLSPDVTADERGRIMQYVEYLATPAPVSRTLARVSVLLSAYYTADIPAAAREMEAEDWAVALGKYPEWAITSAARWWQSADNPDRRKKPLTGDIEARCRLEMVKVNQSRAACLAWKPQEPKADPAPSLERQKQMAEETRAILRSFGVKIQGDEND